MGVYKINGSHGFEVDVVAGCADLMGAGMMGSVDAITDLAVYYMNRTASVGGEFGVSVGVHLAVIAAGRGCERAARLLGLVRGEETIVEGQLTGNCFRSLAEVLEANFTL
jgi:hypothetical protein